MSAEHPPSLDPVAARRWERVAPPASPWLHEEVARRMEGRLQWIRRAPEVWADWEPVRGGLQAHRDIERRYPRAAWFAVEPQPVRERAARQALGRPWWRRWSGAEGKVAQVPDGAAQMVWANMLLHTSADPQALLARWHRALGVDGFLMFSCLGPDTLRELRELYAACGWPPPSHEFTDMHDWGDMLVAGGFAEPVMDMERITLTYETPARLLAELREIGANLHRERFPALRGRRWRERLERELSERLRDPDGRLALTFEIVYGHAFKPPPRPRVAEHSAVALHDMRAMLQVGKRANREDC
jgi:malonyl-CoA O-methyltransferase